MCGIVTIIGNTTQDAKRHRSMLAEISHRGEPDFFNESRNLGTCILGTNRLAIVDLERARQPMVSCNRYYTVFNGEIYNHIELRRELERFGYVFATDSDTEVIGSAFDCWGNGFVKRLRGMFAFVVFDVKKNSYFAGRDPFGIKPLYYSVDEFGKLYFASEIKALSRIEQIKKIRMFPPGSYMRDGVLKKYWNTPKPVKNTLNKQDVVRSIRKYFDEAVKVRVQTNLPVAVYMSGGVDSTSVLVTARKHNTNVTAIIFGSEFSFDRITAVRFCKEQNIPYIAVTPPTEKEMFKLVPEIVRITESFEPNMIRQSAVSYFISQVAAKHGFKVVLCGEGADELFAGYPEFAEMKCGREIDRNIKKFVEDLHKTQLQRVDRTSMFFTVEVRVPFLDKIFAEYALKIPAIYKVNADGQKITTKHVFREAMKDRLPDYIVNREKVVLSEGAGFGGNQQYGGLFYNLACSQITDTEFVEYKKKYSSWNLRTKEEVYYFKYFLKYAYSKAVFNKKRTMVNKTKSLTTETGLARKIIKSINTWSLKREQMHLMDEAVRMVCGFVKNNQPIRFVMYWGKGRRESVSLPEQKALIFLREFCEKIQREYVPGSVITFVYTDTHAVLNGHDSVSIMAYLDSLRDLVRAQSYPVDIVLMSSLQKFNIKTLSDVARNACIDKRLLKLLVRSSEKHNSVILDNVFGAKLYFTVNQMEKIKIQEAFQNHIFLTYNSSVYNSLLPDKLPIFYMYSLNKGTSVKPWFV